MDTACAGCRRVETTVYRRETHTHTWYTVASRGDKIRICRVTCDPNLSYDCYILRGREQKQKEEGSKSGDGTKKTKTMHSRKQAKTEIINTWYLAGRY